MKNEDLVKRVIYWQMKYKDMITEKNKEIEELKHFYDWEKEMLCRGACKLFKEKEIEICHQVCEEIKTKIEEYIEIHKWKYKDADGRHKIAEIPYFAVVDIIDKIKKGE